MLITYLISKIHKKLLQHNSRKNDLKEAEDLNRHFFKENIQIAIRCVKKIKTPNIKEMAIKAWSLTTAKMTVEENETRKITTMKIRKSSHSISVYACKHMQRTSKTYLMFTVYSLI